ncbi:hypothetical protein QSJ18_03115 [Gordonia sp. ABSL1-1]|uniref:hypothetical protein n=1 Tax=Gordonia sp. ABSL1-1 TaxID=3053923 RepID=UPI0025728B53|nr:hypothetical protein [Gordonia sp. ABSL1-1]MDL9935727.1 hypothetical protein [Gordonia sp. ABSL1-1]
MDRAAVIAVESQRLADACARADPGTRCPTCPDWTPADLLWHLVNVHLFWGEIVRRRIIDAAELPAGVGVSALESGVAEGVVDHAVDVMWGWLPGDASYRAEAVVEFVAADVDRRWLVECGSWAKDSDGERFPRAVRASTGTPAATVTAEVDDLARWAWTRGETVAITGDESAIAALTEVVGAGIG